MLAVKCPEVKTARGETLVSERRIVRMVDDGAGVITVTVLCYCGHLHEVVTGRATTAAAATSLNTSVDTSLATRRPARVAAPAAVAC